MDYWSGSEGGGGAKGTLDPLLKLLGGGGPMIRNVYAIHETGKTG